MELELKSMLTLDEWKRLAMLIFGVVFVGVGISLIIYGANLSNQTPVLQIEAEENPLTTGILGGVYVALGLLGVASAVLRIRIVIKILAGFLILQVIVNTVQTGDTILFLLDRDIPKELDKVEKYVLYQYGDNKTHAEFTKIINEFHKTEKCCGWTGIDGANLYQNTPWFKEVNFYKGPKNLTRTLPDSCCTAVNENCYAAEDLKLARNKGYVYKDDCMEKSALKMKSALLPVKSKYIIFYIIEIVNLVIVIKYLIKSKNKE